jgi:hypothetical protein
MMWMPPAAREPFGKGSLDSPKLFGPPPPAKAAGATIMRAAELALMSQKTRRFFPLLPNKARLVLTRAPLRRHQALSIPFNFPKKFERKGGREKLFPKDSPRIEEQSPRRVFLTWRGLTFADAWRVQMIPGDFGTESTHTFTHG